MPRGYRYVILAAFGWLALTGQHPSPSAEREQAEAQHSIADSLSNIATANRDLAERAKSPSKREPCGPRNYQGDDDLCAQWKAADAAADAAWWTVVGSAISAASLVGVIIALAFARQSNTIARDTAKRQLRAYVLLADETDFSGVGPNGEVGAVLKIKNYGQTPAKELVCQSNILIGRMPIPNEAYDLIPGSSVPSRAVLGSQAVLDFPIACSNRLNVPDRARFANGDIFFLIHGVMTYDDIFGDKWSTNFRIIYNPKTNAFDHCAEGNKTT